MSDDAWTLCAVVDAQDAEDAKKAVKIDWPEAEEWRFAHSVEPDYIPGDRFPVTVVLSIRFISGAE